MNPFEFVLAIIAITTIGGILRARAGGYSGRRLGRGRSRLFGDPAIDGEDQAYLPRENAENVRLREEVKMLKERVQTLERIAVDKENSLAREIDSLRDR